MPRDARILIDPASVRIEHTGDDRAVMVGDGEKRLLSMVRQAFPLSQPDHMLVLYDQEGHEIGLLNDVNELDEDSAAKVRELMDRSYFIPNITEVLEIEPEFDLQIWDVKTENGRRSFQVRNPRQNIIRMGPHRLVIKDVDGNRYQIKDLNALDDRDRELLLPYT